MKSHILISTLAISLLVSPCIITDAPIAKHEVKPSKIFYKVGKAYTRKGKTYHPQVYASYTKVGKASWYGPGFHGKLTANGDVFNANDLTAAHPTLPLYSRVWVTNLENGKKILVTVNDRGPYADNRLMDLSRKAAEILGYERKGVTKIKVVYDKQETEKYLKLVGLYEQYRKINK